MKKVIVGMSGGVDSSVAAYLLKQQGYDVEGVSFKLWEARNRCDASVCCSDEAVNSASETANKLGIKHIIIDVRDQFIEKVIEPFVDAYMKGLTPNPCILCNAHIKFPFLMKRADETGASYIATGHYARIEEMPDNLNSREFFIKKGIDANKDQSYFLYILTQQDLKKVLFPLGEYTKEKIRSIAHSLHLPAADRPESQEICFVENKDYSGFIEKLIPGTVQPGPILAKDGRVAGMHKGIYSYTIGQRKGLGISYPEPLYVTKIDHQNNSIQIGLREDAMATGIFVSDMNWIMRVEDLKFRASVKVRSMMDAVYASIYFEGNTAKIIFDNPQWAPAPGQSAVIYDNEIVLGGGIIRNVIQHDKAADI